MQVRAARAGDALPIARVHVESSRATYAGLLPDESLAGFTVERRAAQWAQELEFDPSWTQVLDSTGGWSGSRMSDPAATRTPVSERAS